MSTVRVVVAADMGRAVPHGLKFQMIQVTGAMMFLIAFFPFILGLMSATGSTADAYAGPVWYLGFFTLAAVMYVGGLKVVSRALQYPVKHCTKCGYKSLRPGRG